MAASVIDPALLPKESAPVLDPALLPKESAPVLDPALLPKESAPVLDPALLPKEDQSKESPRVLVQKNLYAGRIPGSFKPRENPGQIREAKMTTSQAIRHFHQFGKVAAMNFASAFNPGGGSHNGTTKGGTRTQEEHLLATTPEAKYWILEYKDEYPLFKGNRSLYIRDVHLELDDDFKPLPRTYSYDMMVAPAPNLNSKYHKSQLEKYSFQEMIDHYMVPMLHNLLICAIKNGCVTVILGDWGCGVFAPKKGKEEYVALVRKTLREYSEKFLPYVKSIVFACPSFK